MTTDDFAFGRRDALKGLAAGGAALAMSGLGWAAPAAAATGPMLKRKIPSSGEEVPVVGLGTARVFNHDLTPEWQARLGGVLEALVAGGGTVIDTANGYGKSEATVGKLVTDLKIRDKVFIATKIGANDRADGIAQIERSLKLFSTDKIELMQVHNLRDWQTQLKTLKDYKERGVFKYIGVTHYSTDAFDQLAAIVKNEKIDFVQVPYAINRRQYEKNLFPLCLDQGCGLTTHRNFGLGNLFQRVRGKPLPAWAKDYDIASWGQFFLKFVIAHPAMTFVIPGTSQARHMADNVQAGYGRMPDMAARDRMASFVAEL
jgi:aryl-alcohol dehydrogenase-like predicted oxidoreductase